MTNSFPRKRRNLKLFLLTFLTSTLLVSPQALAGDSSLKTPPRTAADYRVLERVLTLQLRSDDPQAHAHALLGFVEMNLLFGLYHEAYAYAVYLHREAPALLEEAQAHAAAKIAFVMTGLPQEADATGIMTRPLADPTEERFWRFAAAARRHEPIDLVPNDLMEGLTIMGRYPMPLQTALLPALLDSVLTKGDALLVRKMLSTIGPDVMNAVTPDCKAWISGRLAEVEGYLKTALTRYSEAGTLTSRCSAQAYLRRAQALLADFKTREDGQQVLNTLLAGWRGDDIEEAALKSAVRLAEEAGAIDDALANLKKISLRFPKDFASDHDLSADAARLALAVLTDKLAIKTPEQAARERALYSAFIQMPDHKLAADLVFGQMLLRAGRTRESLNVLTPLWVTSKPTDPRVLLDLGLTLAAAYLRDGTADKARQVLDRLPGADKPHGWSDARRYLEIETMIANGQADPINPEILAEVTPADRIALAQARLHANDWDGALRLMREDELPSELQSPEFRETLAAAAILAHRVAQMGDFTKPLAESDAAVMPLTKLATASAEPHTTGEIPGDAIARMLASTKTMIATADAIAKQTD